jgi:hypothetical protein
MREVYELVVGAACEAQQINLTRLHVSSGVIVLAATRRGASDRGYVTIDH